MDNVKIKRVLASAAAAWAACTLAIDWTGSAGNFLLDNLVVTALPAGTCIIVR